jgi:hypothetical protein
MKVFIKSCADPLMWYSNHINTVREVMYYEDEYKMYWGVTDDGFTNYILKEDAFLVEE